MRIHLPSRKVLFHRVSVLLAFLLVSFFSFSQDATVSGVVRDKNNVPVPGASVMVKGSTSGVSTDQNGNFTITARRGAVLVISSVNYKSQELPIGSSLQYDVSLEPGNSQMEEVVVIGYGTRQRKDVTGAVSTVGSKDIEKNTSLTPELALQGRAAGVLVNSGGGDPQSRPTVRIRGGEHFWECGTTLCSGRGSHF